MAPRRTFLAQLAAALATLSAGGAAAAAQSRTTEPPATDDEWLRGLTGQHRQFLDTGTMNGDAPLRRAANYLDGYRDGYGVPESRVNLVVGVHGSALPLVLGDAVWQRYALGAKHAVADPATGAPATRNPFATAMNGHAVAELQRRGVRFIACRQSMLRLSRELTPAGDEAAAASRFAELVPALLPGVILVPAMIVAVNRAHEAGLSYVFVG